ncbi:Acetyltransferase (GNAT) family protein [Saccharopolyspora shandongensis]|uniref:Acetyltransferase (GNAT) family protein n=1 Tax=Saccharopolyspora shandongensis TaxID=418495 RepID=A0A1H3RB67_9PSEU|nr:GNAT family N-acetyltransferase [Saccharopolyspora shandongensis]SDZ22763.1 Acetyltransferase (GNAT) family protein [Saccharopolyspora shandongensis]
MSSVEAEIERAAVATWPASTVEHADGWVLRHCGLLNRKRSNSALPPAAVPDPDAAVELVEKFYAAREAAPIVQVSPLDRHAELDAFLAGRGYRVVGRTSAMFADCDRVLGAPEDFEVRLEPGPQPSWLVAAEAVGRQPEPSLDRIPQPVRFAIALRGGVPVGVGTFVVSSGWCGIYGMATSPDWRRRGVASAVLRAGARWASGAGAKRLFLQVEDDNPGARSCYEALGFIPSHGYHYRVR